MLRRLSANHETFLPIEFGPGFNIILADRAEDATQQHSRNARGKTTILSAINYCLGGNLPAPLRPLADDDWSFTLTLDLFGGQVSATRSIARGSRVHLAYPVETARWLITYVDESGYVTVDDWKFLLGLTLFGLDVEYEDEGYKLSARTLISYVVRLDALKDPLKVIPQQPAWSWREHVAYLLDLDWRHTRALARIKKEAETYDALQYAAGERLLPGLLRPETDLLLERAQAQRRVSELEARVSGFQVIDEPRSMIDEADHLTEELRALRNSALIDTRLVELYRAALTDEETIVDVEEVARLYEQLGRAFTPDALQELEDVERFHAVLVANRRSFLQTEIDRLEAAEAERERELQRVTASRNSIMSVLESGGALEELTHLQSQLNDATGHLVEIETAIGRVRELASAKEGVKFRQAQHRRAASYDLEDHRDRLDSVAGRFDSMMQRLYDRSGVLTAEVDNLGYKFSLKVAGIASGGITRMQLFCFDHTLLAESRNWSHHPDFLIHDSAVFDGVDPRQVEAALNLARDTVQEVGAQYICTMNSNDVPDGIWKSDWFEDGIRRTVYDTDEGGILGVLF